MCTSLCSCSKNATKECNTVLKYKTKTSCMSGAARSKIRLNRECLFATWEYVLTNFKTTLQTGTWEVVKEVTISLNSLKIKDQRVFFHKKFDNILDYQILSFETLLHFQWRQQYFVCFRKLFVCLWVNTFLKNQMIGRGHRMSHWSSWDSSHGSVCALGQILPFLFLSTFLFR